MNTMVNTCATVHPSTCVFSSGHRGQVGRASVS